MLQLLMLLGAIGLVSWVVLSGVSAILAGHLKCPSCRVRMIPLETAPTEPDGQTAPTAGYAILTCPSCTNAATVAESPGSGLAPCPQCGRLTLATPCIRLPDESGYRRVEVHEHCGACGYERTRTFRGNGAPEGPRGLVIPLKPDD